MRYTPALLAALMMTAPAAVSAQDFYGHVFGGATFLQDPNFEGIVTPPGGPQSVDNDFDTGYNFGVAVGRSLPSLNFGQFKVRGAGRGLWWQTR